MEQQVLCIDGGFSPDQMAFFSQYGVSLPQQNKIYTVREVINHVSREAGSAVGLRLEEIINPPVPTQHPVLPAFKMEPTFNIKRFAHLDGSSLSEGEVKEWARQHELLKKLNF